MSEQSAEMVFPAQAREHETVRPTRPVVLAAAAALLIVLANVFAAAYVSVEQSIYYWDFSLYWKKFGLLGRLLQSDPAAAFTYSIRSIATENYTALPIIPLAPFALSFGDGRMPYILAITNVALLPSAALIACVAEKTMQSWSWPRFVLATAAVLCIHVLWAPTLRGFPDVLGVGIACAVLLVYFNRPLEQRRTLHLIGLLLCLLILTRRWYLFWAISFFPAAILSYALGSSREHVNWRTFRSTSSALLVIGLACAVCIILLAAPLVIRMAITDYSAQYAAYRPDLAGADRLGQVAGHFGVALLALSVSGLAWLTARERSRAVGIFLIVQGAISLALFVRVQGLLGVQHYLLLVPTVGIGIAAAVNGLWDARLSAGLRAGGIAAVFAIALASAAVVLLPIKVRAEPLLPRVHYAPLVRSDLAQIERMMQVLEGLGPEKVYVVASSDVLNWDTLKTGCRVRHPTLCRHVATTADIDARDGFPSAVLDADYVVLATPTQYHVRPEDQQVVGLVASDIRHRRRIGASFEPVAEQFELMRGVRAQIYRRTSPIRAADANALGEQLVRSYPNMKNLPGRDRERSR